MTDTSTTTAVTTTEAEPENHAQVAGELEALITAPPTQHEEVSETTETETTTTQETVEEPVISPAKNLSAIARREKRILDRENNLKSQEAKLQALEQFTELLQKDPVAVLAQLGWDKDKLADAILKIDNGAGAEADRLAAIEKKIADTEANQIKREQQAQLESIRTNITTQISNQTERFDLINTFDYHDEVFTAVLEYSNKYPEWRPSSSEVIALVNTIADKVEAELDSSLLGKVKNSKKFQANTGHLPTPSNTSKSVPAKPQTISPPNTLTNTNVRHSTPTEDGLSINADERWDQLTKQAGFRS